MAIYYVSTTGGTGAGTTTGASWSGVYALTKLSSSVLKPGDSMLFNRGDTFYGSFSPGNLGTSGSPITFGAYGTGANPIITGFSTLSATTWVHYSGNIYYYPTSSMTISISSYLQAVTIDGVIHQMGRYPRNTWNTYASSPSSTSLSDTSIGVLPFNPTGGRVVNRKERYIIDVNPIVSVSGNVLTFSGDTIYGNNSTYTPIAGNGYFIQSHIGCLTTSGATDGDWYYDSINHKFYMYFVSTPTGRTVQISTLDICFNNASATYINISNIDFVGANQAGINNGGNSNGINISNCGIRQCGSNGIYGGQTISTIINSCIISDSLNSGIFFEYNDTSVSITNCTITNSGLIRGAGPSGYGGQSGIAVLSNIINITGNTVTNCGYNGIDFSFYTACTIQYNKVDTCCLIKDDGGGLYTYIGTGATIDHNIILNCVGAYDGGVNGFYYEPFGKAMGIYLDNGDQLYNNNRSHNATVTNNVCFNGGAYGIFQNANGGNNINNNLVYNFGQAQFFIVDADAPARGCSFTYNTFISKSGQTCMGFEFELADTISSIGTFNHNIYARPADDTTTIKVVNIFSNPNTNVNMTLANWINTYSVDVNSNKSAISSADSNFISAYNYTNSSVNYALSQSAIDVFGSNYNTVYSIPAYGGMVLLNGFATNVFCSFGGKLLGFGSKLLTINL